MFANPRTNPHPGTALRRFDGATGARLAAALIVWTQYPETAQRELEEINPDD